VLRFLEDEGSEIFVVSVEWFFLFVFACAIKQVFLFIDDSGEFCRLEDTI
jgi:hypothetical protein